MTAADTSGNGDEGTGSPSAPHPLRVSHKFGPWVAISLSGYRDHGAHLPIFADGYWHIHEASNPEQVPIAVVDHANDHDPETRAKAADIARLIAASPDLVKALSELLDAFECEPDDLMPHEYEAIVADAKARARAALSKAGV